MRCVPSASAAIQPRVKGEKAVKRMVVLVLALSAYVGGALGAQGLSLTSPDIKPDAKIADEQVGNCNGSDGKNISPALAWSGAPKNTKSFALTVYDPDAPTGSGLWHWVVIDIPADVASLAKGAGDLKSDAAPKGSLQPKTDVMPGYMGPVRPPAPRTTTRSRSMRSTQIKSTPTRTLRRRSSAYSCIIMPSPRRP